MPSRYHVCHAGNKFVYTFQEKDSALAFNLDAMKDESSYPPGMLEDKVQCNPQFLPLRPIRQETSQDPDYEPQEARVQCIPRQNEDSHC